MAGKTPRFTDDGRQIVSLGRGRGSYALLSKADGALTKAGKFLYEESTRQRPNASFDSSQPLIRHGNTDYVRLRSGLQKPVRTLQANGSFKISRLGRVFFKNKYTSS